MGSVPSPMYAYDGTPKRECQRKRSLASLFTRTRRRRRIAQRSTVRHIVGSFVPNDPLDDVKSNSGSDYAFFVSQRASTRSHVVAPVPCAVGQMTV